MDDITRHGNIVRFAIDESFLRADTMARLLAIEKMIQLGLITKEQAAADEQMAPTGMGENLNDINL